METHFVIGPFVSSYFHVWDSFEQFHKNRDSENEYLDKEDPLLSIWYNLLIDTQAECLFFLSTVELRLGTRHRKEESHKTCACLIIEDSSRAWGRVVCCWVDDFSLPNSFINLEARDCRGEVLGPVSHSATLSNTPVSQVDFRKMDSCILCWFGFQEEVTQTGLSKIWSFFLIRPHRALQITLRRFIYP